MKPTKELFLYFRFYPDGSVVSLLSTLLVKLRECLGRGTRIGCDASVSGFPEFRFHATDDWNDAIYGAEMREQKLAAGCLCERKLSTGVNRAEVVEILLGRRKLEETGGVTGGLNAKERVEWQLSDTGFHVCDGI